MEIGSVVNTALIKLPALDFSSGSSGSKSRVGETAPVAYQEVGDETQSKLSPSSNPVIETGSEARILQTKERALGNGLRITA